MEHNWKLPAFARFVAEIVTSRDCPVFLCTYKSYAVALADQLRSILRPDDYAKILLMPGQQEDTLPYFHGTNGDNRYRTAKTVILLGYPRLDAQAYLSAACAAYGDKDIATALACVSEEELLHPRFNLLTLPLLQQYVSHHLAARLEQDIYRSAQRDPDFTGSIHIHLFCPPKDVLKIITTRIPGRIIIDNALPDYVQELRIIDRKFQEGNTSRGRLLQFLNTWDGTPVRTCDLRTQLDISASVWKDLMKDVQIQKKLTAMGVSFSGRGSNRTWSLLSDHCA